MSDEERRLRIERLAAINRSFATVVPHNRALGMTVVELGDGIAVLQLPYDARLVGNPENGVLHGGVISSLMDATCGAAVFQALDLPKPIATLDLRIDYLRPAEPGRDVAARCHCYKVTRNVAFVRGVAYHDSPDDPIAACAGAFMLATKLGRGGRTL
ncbi:MAG TPA: PaaI family thioesterase [Kofleriaceae bacterium]|jgi:uncharacterized protein (TIGR00369 family)|nr:PaaI family thioesterase [Kofleriaceae bacterium]